MSNSSARRFPVTVTRLPVTRCQLCHRTVAYRPGTLSEVLTGHYRRAHRTHQDQTGAILADSEPGALKRGGRSSRSIASRRNTSSDPIRHQPEMRPSTVTRLVAARARWRPRSCP